MGMSIDLFATSLPGISTSINTLTYISKMIIFIYLIGYALDNLVVGTVTDVLGRKALLRVSCVIFVVASLLPTLISNEYVPLKLKILSRISYGVNRWCYKRFFSDILPPEKLIKLGSTISFLW